MANKCPNTLQILSTVRQNVYGEGNRNFQIKYKRLRKNANKKLEDIKPERAQVFVLNKKFMKKYKTFSKNKKRTLKFLLLSGLRKSSYKRIKKNDVSVGWELDRRDGEGQVRCLNVKINTDKSKKARGRTIKFPCSCSGNPGREKELCLACADTDYLRRIGNRASSLLNDLNSVKKRD